MEIGLETRYTSIFLILSTGVHFLGMSNFLVAIILRTYVSIVREPRTKFIKFGYNFKNLNSINAVVQLMYNILALTVDVMIWTSYTRDVGWKYHLARSYVRSTLAFPLGMFVAVVFYVLSSVSKDSFYYPGFQEYESWLSFMLHACNPLFLISDIFVCKGESPKLKYSILALAIINISYDLWIHILYLYTQVWMVPIIGTLSFVAKLLAYVAMFLIHVSTFFLGRIINEFLWNDESNYFKFFKCQQKRNSADSQGSEVEPSLVNLFRSSIPRRFNIGTKSHSVAKSTRSNSVQ